MPLIDSIQMEALLEGLQKRDPKLYDLLNSMRKNLTSTADEIIINSNAIKSATASTVSTNSDSILALISLRV